MKLLKFQKKIFKNFFKQKKDHLVIVKKLVKNLNNQVLISSLPIKLSKLIEKLNIEFLKKNFHNQSELKLKNINLI
jgi:hypothetical protein